ncbi:MAG: M23 family metallopeptidase [Bacilli bacterium]|nr:M23 family metallopeptidase [Bacilli bacterium]
MLDNFILFVEKLITSFFKFLFRVLKSGFIKLFKFLFRLVKPCLVKFKSFISNKFSTQIKKIKSYYKKYIIDSFRNLKHGIKNFKHKKLVIRFAVILLFISVIMTGYYFGPTAIKHYKSTNNSLTFVEYNTHVENSSDNKSANVVQVNNEVKTEPAPEPEPAPVIDTSYRWPTEDGYYITTYFSRTHDGIDIAGCGWNSNIYAIYSGEVVTSSFTSTNGNYIIIKDDKGVYSMYAHLANKYVWAGQRVEKGQVIGGMGSTGFSTGTHLHFSTWNGYPYYGGTAFNPYSIY